jgi:YVTN family beta-propeller protein
MRPTTFIKSPFAKILFGAACLGVLGLAGVEVTRRHAVIQANDVTPDGATVLPNGWKVTPAGRAVVLGGDMPSKIVWLPGGQEALIMTSGFNATGITAVDGTTGEMVKKVVLPEAWCGLAVSPDGSKVYASEGSSGIATFTVVDGKLEPKTQDPEKVLPKGAWVAGLATLPSGQVAAIDMNSDQLYILNANGLSVEKKITVGRKPFAVLALAGGALAVTNEGGESVSFVDPEAGTVTATVKVGSHPTELVQDSEDHKIYVANAGSNSVSVIDGKKVVETIKTSLVPNAPVGSTPISLALSPDHKRLYVANADNNDVAVIELGRGGPSEVVGFVPTGWYPSLVACDGAGKLWVGSGKGLKFGANGPANPEKRPNGQIVFKYIGSMLKGNLNIVDAPDGAALKEYTQQVFANAPTMGKPTFSPSEIAAAQRNILSKIKHVVYVIRENRTYDQVFGDMAKGNGDPKLTMFGADVTPNAHKLANEFVLLDNTYCNGEVSQDGHEWCNSAYCTEFTEKAWVSSYSRRGEPDGGDEVDASPAGHLWDNCRKHGKSYMAYGEASSFKSDPNTAPVFTGSKGLEGHSSYDWSYDHGRDDRDYQRMDIFLDDLKKGEATGKWPNYMVMSLGEDHTSGYKAGAFTPEAAVASNDLALGKMVDTISHSRFWKDTAIFVIEDDAQNGPDHVDAHRTVALFISPYTKRGAVDSTMYTTASLVRTMELALGLPPMTQFDQGATPMLGSLAEKPDFTPYTLVQEQVNLNAVNLANTLLAQVSAHLDFSAYDRADPDTLNWLLWQGRKGNVPMPSPVRSAVIRR